MKIVGIGGWRISGPVKRQLVSLKTLFVEWRGAEQKILSVAEGFWWESLGRLAALHAAQGEKKPPFAAREQ
jgi:hypothetical protein